MAIKLKGTRIFDGTKVIADIVDQKVVCREGHQDRRGEIVATLNSGDAEVTEEEPATVEETPEETPEVEEAEEEVEEVPEPPKPKKAKAVVEEEGLVNMDVPPPSPFVHSMVDGHPYMVNPDDVDKLPFGLILKAGIPKPPKLDPLKGTKTPVFMHWMNKWFPEEFKQHYHNYYVRQGIIRSRKAKKAAQLLT